MLSKVTKTELSNIIKNSQFYKEALVRLGYGSHSGSMYAYLRSKCDELGVDYSHLGTGKGAVQYKNSARKLKIPLEDILVPDSSYHNNSSLKKRLINEKILPYICTLCSNNGIHNGHPLVLQLDHINGINNDHSLTNLRFLCPNCHSQTKTYAGKNKKCKEIVYPSCTLKVRRATKIDWPPVEEVLDMLEYMPCVKVAKILGVSDTSVRKYIKRNKID